MCIPPTATYRLQFHSGFTFAQALQILPYLRQLGISHVYASPFFRAGPGSTHGYDVRDHNRLNSEIGTREDFETLSAQLRTHGLGLIVDFVPNHMGIEGALNPWWRDVLKYGELSPYARFFDIDWEPPKRELEHKVLLPILGEQYGRVLEADGFLIEFVHGEFLLRYEQLTLPLNSSATTTLLRQAAGRMFAAPAELENILGTIEALEGSVNRVREWRVLRERILRLHNEESAFRAAIEQTLGAFRDITDPTRFDRLDQLISAQAYRLSSWRVAGEEINYRRFFDVNTLAAIRVELPEVYNATHQLLFELMDGGHISGVRVDHIDGLACPGEYLARLREHGGDALYLVVEKILGPDEQLRRDWKVQGTTGYEFTNQLLQLLILPGGIPRLTATYEKFLGFPLSYREVVYRSKRLVIQSSMASEVNVLGNLLNRISETHRWYRDFTLNALTTAVREVIACFPVYRTYIDPTQSADQADANVIHRAIHEARRRNRALDKTVFRFLRDVLLPRKENPHPVDEDLRRTFVLKFQQCTGPIAAKGVEDTAFYVFNRLTALNEVGGEPVATGIPVETFHRQNLDRHARFPDSLLATSTHDTKRSEDVRARLAALSELSEEWTTAVRRWHVINRKHLLEIDGESAPDANEEYLFYQVLVGTWPLEGLNVGNRSEFIRRIQDYMVKALREAKVNSSWIDPNAAWEDAVRGFVAAALATVGRNRFPQSLALFAGRIAWLGAMNSLAQTVLKLTCPGVPDFYQGSEIWDFSLVDPDNRRPVDFAFREKLLANLANTPPAELLESWHDGRIKMFVIHRILSLRREKPELFARGAYEDRAASGAFANKVIAFERRSKEVAILIVVPRHTASLGIQPIGAAWGDTHLPNASGAKWCDIFSGRAARNLALSEIFAELPFAVLVHV